MQASETVFVIFWEDDVWKLYRDGELVAPYTSRELAETSANQFIAEMERFGKRAVIRGHQAI